MKVIKEKVIINFTVLRRLCGSRILDLNSSSAYLAQIPAVVFSASTSLLKRISSRTLFLSCAASSLLNLALVSSSKAGLDSKFAGTLSAPEGPLAGAYDLRLFEGSPYRFRH